MPRRLGPHQGHAGRGLAGGEGGRSFGGDVHGPPRAQARHLVGDAGRRAVRRRFRGRSHIALSGARGRSALPLAPGRDAGREGRRLSGHGDLQPPHRRQRRKGLRRIFPCGHEGPPEWAKLAKREASFPDEVFAAGTDYWPTLFAKWDQKTAAHPFTGIAANDSHQNQTYNGVTFDPYEVSFRNVSTTFWRAS